MSHVYLKRKKPVKPKDGESRIRPSETGKQPQHIQDPRPQSVVSNPESCSSREPQWHGQHLSDSVTYCIQPSLTSSGGNGYLGRSQYLGLEPSQDARAFSWPGEAENHGCLGQTSTDLQSSEGRKGSRDRRSIASNIQRRDMATHFGAQQRSRNSTETIQSMDTGTSSEYSLQPHTPPAVTLESSPAFSGDNQSVPPSNRTAQVHFESGQYDPHGDQSRGMRPIQPPEFVNPDWHTPGVAREAFFDEPRVAEAPPLQRIATMPLTTSTWNAYPDSQEHFLDITGSKIKLPPLNQRHTDTTLYMHRQPIHKQSFDLHFHSNSDAYVQRITPRDSGWDQLGVGPELDTQSDQGGDSFDTFVTVWQDGGFETPRMCAGVHMKYDTQCQNSNWITATTVRDLGAITTRLPERLPFRGFNGGPPMVASEEVQLTWREDSKAGKGPRRMSRFFIAPDNDVFEMILGQKDIQRFGILRRSVLYKYQGSILGLTGPKKTKADKVEDAQRVAVHEAEIEARELKRKKREEKSRQSSENTSTRSSRQNTSNREDNNSLSIQILED